MPRIALAQIKPAKGDYATNLDRIGGVLQQAAAVTPRIDLVVFPETVTSGYFVEGGVRQVAVTAGTLARDLAERHKAAGGVPLDVAVGFYEVYQSRLFNSCLYATLDGGEALVRHVHRKCFLPTYGLFDEERFVDKGHDIRAFDTGFGWRAAVLICEDVWHSLSGIIAAVDGARLFIVPSASPARGTAQDEEGLTLPASMVRWERLVRGVAEEHGVYVALANLVGFEGGKGFSGGSAVIDPMGHITIRGPLFEESLLTADLDPDTITHARADAPMLGDLESELPHLVRSLEHAGQGSATQEAPREGRDYDPVQEKPAVRSPRPAPPVPLLGLGYEADDPLQLDCELVRRWLVAFLKDEVVRRRGFAKALVGVSGGVDSALTATLAVAALGREHVLAVRMPYRTGA
jgi:predicted amidohydrolase